MYIYIYMEIGDLSNVTDQLRVKKVGVASKT